PSVADRYEDIVEFISAISLHLRSLDTMTALSADRHDFVKAIETLQKSLIAPSLTHGPELAVGIAKSRGPLALDLYHELCKLADVTSLLIMAETRTTDIDAIAHIALLKGLIHGLLHATFQDPTQRLDLLDFTAQLNSLLYHNIPRLQFSFSSLLLDSSQS